MQYVYSRTLLFHYLYLHPYQGQFLLFADGAADKIRHPVGKAGLYVRPRQQVVPLHKGVALLQQGADSGGVDLYAVHLYHADDLTAAFLRFPTQLALSFYGSMSTLLALNPTWQKYAPKIQEQILAKQEADRIHVEGDYVIEKNVEREVSHVAAGGTGFSIN